MIVLIEADAYNLTTTAVETLRWASAKFISKASDTPARTPYLHCITRRPNYTRSLHGEGRTFGPHGGAPGGFALGNGWDQRLGVFRLDHYKTTYRFNGRAVRVYLVARSSSTLASRTLWATARFNGEPEYGEDEIAFSFQDREQELAQQVLTGVLQGTNGVAGAILEGIAEQKGTYKQKIWGNVKDGTGQLVHPGLVIYRLNDGPFRSISQIRDRGLASFSVVADHANATALASATVSATEAMTCRAEGLVRLGSLPAGEVRFDVDTDTSTAASIIADLITIAGWSGGDLTAGTASALLAATNAPLQLLVADGAQTVGEALDLILQSIGGHRIHERLGTMSLGIMGVPSSVAAVKTITAAKSGDIEIRPSADTNLGLPPWKTRVHWYKRWAPLSRTDFAGAVTASAIADQSMPARVIEAITSTVSDANPQSEPFDIETLHVDSSSAQAFASTQQALRGPVAGRGFYVIPGPLDEHTDLDPADVILLKRNRYNLTGGGKPLAITTMTEDLEENEVTLEGFG